MEDEERCDLERFDYERGEGRTKHRWKNDYSGFVPTKRGPVGKCHSSISDAIAVKLLRTGFPDPDPFETEDGCDGSCNDEGWYPERVYNVYRGIPYVAVPTQPGKSYHGYPHRGRLSASMREKLAAKAERDGRLREFEKWLKKYGEG